MTCDSTLQIYTDTITSMQSNLCTKLFTAALFKSKGLATTQMSINRSLFKLWYIHTMDYSVTVEEKKERGSSPSTIVQNPPTYTRRKTYFAQKYNLLSFTLWRGQTWIHIHTCLSVHRNWKDALDTDSTGWQGMVEAKLGQNPWIWKKCIKVVYLKSNPSLFSKPKLHQPGNIFVCCFIKVLYFCSD